MSDPCVCTPDHPDDDNGPYMDPDLLELIQAFRVLSQNLSLTEWQRHQQAWALMQGFLNQHGLSGEEHPSVLNELINSLIRLPSKMPPIGPDWEGRYALSPPGQVTFPEAPPPVPDD
jgi:hypothetical protein